MPCEDHDFEEEEQAVRPPGEGRYLSWGSVDAEHSAMMRIIAGQIPDEPVCLLWLHVLNRAIVDAYILTGRTAEDRDSIREARLWLRGRGPDYVCTAIGLHPEWVRKLIGIYASRAPGAHTRYKPRAARPQMDLELVA